MATFLERLGDRIWTPPQAERAVLSNGTVLIGRRPPGSRSSWLHAFFPPLDPGDEPQLLDVAPTIPPEVKNCLFESGNGLRLFDSSCNLLGLRTNRSRGVEAALGQPFSIEQIELPDDLPQDLFRIGSYTRTGHHIYISRQSGHIVASSRDTYASLFEWPSFDEFLDQEVNRLSAVYASIAEPTRFDVLPWTEQRP